MVETKVPDLVHGMIVFLLCGLSSAAFSSQRYWLNSRRASLAGGKAQLFQAQQLADPANAVENIVLGREDGVDARGRRMHSTKLAADAVHRHPQNGALPGKGAQCLTVTPHRSFVFRFGGNRGQYSAVR